MKTRASCLMQRLLAVMVLLSALAVLSQPALSQEPDPDEGTTTAAGSATQIDCNNPPAGQSGKLFSEDEILVGFRNEIGTAQIDQLDNTGRDNLQHDRSFQTVFPDAEWQALTMADLNGDRKGEVVTAFRQMEAQLIVHTYPHRALSGWGADYGEIQGDIEYIDIAAGNLDRSNNGDDEIIVAFADDGDDLRLLALQGNAQGRIRNSYNHVWKQWYADDATAHGRGDVSHVALVTGDLDGDKHDDEIIVAFKDDGNDDLQVMVFKVTGGALKPVADKVWSGNDERNDLDYNHNIFGDNDPVRRGIDVTAGDIDGNYRDEILVAFSEESGNDLQVFSLAYDGDALDETGTIEAEMCDGLKDEGLCEDDPYHSFFVDEVSIAAADLNGNGQDKVAVASVYAGDPNYLDTQWPIVRTFVYKNDDLKERRSSPWSRHDYERDDVQSISIDAGDLDMDGDDELAVAFQDDGDDLQVWALDGDLTERSHCQDRSGRRETVEYVWAAVGDIDGDSSYGDYENDCSAFTEARLTAVVFPPPTWPSNRGGSTAGFGEAVTHGTGHEESTTTTQSGSVTLDESLSIEFIDIGPSMTHEIEHSTTSSSEEMVRHTDSTGVQAGFRGKVVYDEVSRWCYKYRESRTGEPLMVCLPHEVQSEYMPLDEWYADGPTDYPETWVPVGVNLARKNSTAQVSTFSSYSSDNAVDGRETDACCPLKRLACTQSGNNPWWQVDLERVQHIDGIQLWGPFCGVIFGLPRPSDFYVFISEDPFSSTDLDTTIEDPSVWQRHITGTIGSPSNLGVNTTGRYVRVQLAGTGQLCLAEVKAWGRPAEVDQFPIGIETINNNKFRLKYTGGDQQTAFGEIQWGETDAHSQFVGHGDGTSTWSAQDWEAWVNTTGTATRETDCLAFAAKAFGIGVDASYCTGLVESESYSLFLAESATWQNAVSDLPDDEPTYRYAPYYYLQNRGKAQSYLVLDYYVDEVDRSAATTEAIQSPAASQAVTPTQPIITSPTHPDPDTWYVTNTATFTWTQPAGDPANMIGYRWYLDGDPDTIPDERNLGLTTTTTYESLPDGQWYLHVRAEGEGGNWSETAHRAVRIDANPPHVDLTLDPPLPTGYNGWYKTPLTATVTATDTSGSGVTTIEVSTDGSTWQPYTDPIRYVTDTVTTTLWARATDAAGHTSKPVSTTFKIDMTPPSSKVEIGGTTMGVWIAHVVTDTLGNQHLVLGGQISDTLSGMAGMDLQIDDFEWTSADVVGTWHPFASQPDIEVNWYYTATTEVGRGKHVIYGRAEDQAGNLETLYELAQVTWLPPDYPDLQGSDLTVTPQIARPGDTVTFTLSVRNSGEQEAHVAITSTLPAALTVVTETLAPDVSYNPATGVITWPAELLWPGQWLRRTFSARVAAGVSATTLDVPMTAHAFWPFAADPTPAQRAYFRAHEDRTTVSATLTVDPDLPAGVDVTPPDVQLSILGDQIATARDVGCYIWADNDARWLYLREWSLSPGGVWTVTRESGWLGYTPTYTWTLSTSEGVKFLGAWAADGAGNVSQLDEQSLAFVNLVGTGRALAAGERAHYRFNLRSGALAAYQALSAQGDPDLYVWVPRNSFRPNVVAEGPGLAEVVGFWSEEAGRYLVEVQAYDDLTYRLTATGEESLDADYLAGSSLVAEKERPDHPLAISDPLSAGSHVTAPALELQELYLPLIFKEE